MNGNWVDLAIILILIYFVAEGIRVGLWAMLADFLSLLISILAAFVLYPYLSGIVQANFSLMKSFSNVLGFLFASVLVGAFVSFLISLVVHKIPQPLWKNRWNHIAAILPAIGEAFIIVSFIVTLVIGIPISPGLKKSVSESRIGGRILGNTSFISGKINEIFGKAIEDSLTYLTVEPGSNETIPLTFAKRELAVDKESETEMFNMVNEARRTQKIGTLTWDEKLAETGRTYATLMWENNFFGHYSPTGENVADRLDNAGVSYTFAGENLAMAPTVMVAHTGLMNSEGHRENILDKNFKKIGVGCVDNGIYGKIFVQVFTD
jgi:uncharacterized protein YkwD